MNTESQKEPTSPPGGIGAWIIWATASLFYLYEYILRVAPSVMVHELMVNFQITAASLGALTALYYFAYSPMQVVVGILLDRFGGRKVLPLAMALAALGSLIFGSTDHFWLAGFGRLLQGVGSAFAFVGAVYVATNWFPERRFAMLSGLTTMLGMVGAAAGLAPLAYILHRTGWQSTWFGMALFGGALVILLWFLIPNRPHWARHPKLKKRQSYTPFKVFENLGRVFKNPQTWIIGLYGGFIYVPTSTFAALWGVPFLEAAHHVSKVVAAAAVSMIFIGWTVGAPLAGWWSDKMKLRKRPMVLGAVVVLFLTALVIYLPFPHIWPIFGLMFLIGVFSGGQVVCFAAAYEANPRQAKGSALAITNMLVMITGAILQPVVGWLLDLRYLDQKIPGTKHLTGADFHFALMVVPASVLLAIVFGFLIRETHGKPPQG